jgi:hypothetical protein
MLALPAARGKFPQQPPFAIAIAIAFVIEIPLNAAPTLARKELRVYLNLSSQNS